MRITTFGHCCLLIEIVEKRVLTDPGMFSAGFQALTNIDLVLITHEHADHLHTESLQAVLEKNPQAAVVTNDGVGRILSELGIAHTVLADRETTTTAGLTIKPYNGKHEEIYEAFGQVKNTGFLLENGEFFYPGDSYIVPNEPVNVLAAPVAGPWCKVADAIRYVLAVHPKQVVPVHDAVLSEAGKAVVYPHFERELTSRDIRFIRLTHGEPTNLGE